MVARAGSTSKALLRAEDSVRDFLAEYLGSRPTEPLFKDPGEDLYLLIARVSNDDSMDLLDAIEPLLHEIADNNDFTIAVIPLPPGTESA
jgi:hypothetical protein